MVLEGENLLSASCTADAIAARPTAHPRVPPCAPAPPPVDLLLAPVAVFLGNEGTTRIHPLISIILSLFPLGRYLAVTSLTKK